jgi:hypothetical protein
MNGSKPTENSDQKSSPTLLTWYVSKGENRVQQLLGHSTVTVAIRYTHTNLESKRNAVAKLERFGDVLVTPCTKLQQTRPQVSAISPLRPAVGYN